MWTCSAKFLQSPASGVLGTSKTTLDGDKVDRCMCAVKAVALIGDRAFLEAFLKNGCNGKQIGSMDTACEEYLLALSHDRNNSVNQFSMQKKTAIVEHYGHVALCVLILHVLIQVLLWSVLILRMFLSLRVF